MLEEVLVEKSVDINQASLEELDRLPGIGPALGQRIIDYREQNNGFYDVQELMDVSGIGEKTPPSWRKENNHGPWNCF